MWIGELIGSTLKGLRTKQFWREERLVSPYCLLYLLGSAGNDWKIYLDDEDLTWKVQPIPKAPAAGTVEGNPSFSYPIVDLKELFPVGAARVCSALEEDQGDHRRLVLSLDGGAALIFQYHYGTEKTSIEFVPA